MFNILLRMNDSCEHVSGKRDVGSKRDVLNVCFKSLVNCIDEYGKAKVNFHVFYDDLSDGMLQEVKQHLDEDKMHKVIRNPRFSRSVSTFNEAYQLGRTLEGPVLLLEDDYYFYPGSLQKIIDFYDQRTAEEGHVCINIMEDFNPPLGDKDEYLFTVDDVKWRKTSHTTFTVMTDAYVLNKYEKRFTDIFNYFMIGIIPDIGGYAGEENTVNKIYEEVNCYAPTPSLSEHMQNWDTLSRGCPFARIREGESIYEIVDVLPHLKEGVFSS